MKKKRDRLENLKNDWFMLRLIWKFTPGLLIWELIFGVLEGLNNSVQVLFIKVFYDYINNNASFITALGGIAGIFAFIVIFQIIKQYYYNVTRRCKRQVLEYRMHTELFEISKSIPISSYDDTEFYDNFVWSVSQSDTRAVGLMETLSAIILSSTSFITIVTLFFSISPALSLAAVAASILSLFIQKASAKIQLQSALETTPKNRKISYYERIYSLPDTAKEVRISHVNELIWDKHRETLEQIREVEEKYLKKNCINVMAGKILTSAVEPFIYIILLYQIMISNTVSISGLAVALSSFWALRWCLQDIVDKLVKLPEHGIYIKKLRAFMEYTVSSPEDAMVPEPFESLTLQNVSFGYAVNKPVLRHIDFSIKRGEKIALVGYNGAGKTTLIKLLLHLYDPVEGKILYNGMDIRKYACRSYQSRFGVVLQDFQIFATSIAENVLRDSYDGEEKASIIKALELCTFSDRLKNLPRGIQTGLTKEFDDTGINLSGGEAQKLAIARVLVRPYDIIIMDEPSSAMDPVAEYEINKNVQAFAQEKTVITISHRLSTTRDVDRIYVLENGEIVECGAHIELMRMNGKYAEMFRVQAKKYQEAAAPPVSE